jgi:hypothetical protein
MKIIKQTDFSIILAYLFCSVALHAQESVNTSGGNANGIGGTVSYSIGQVAFTTISNNNGSVAQGVQQAYEIFTIGINEDSTNIQLSTYPNPISDFVVLQVEGLPNQKMNYILLDANGREVSSNLITTQQTLIPMEKLENGIYFLYVRSDFKMKIQTFKIIKNRLI